MNPTYREIVESIDSIMQEDESAGEQQALSPQVLLKDIVHSLKGCIDKLSVDETEDYEKLVSDLKKVRDILAEQSYDVSTEDEVAITEDDDCCFGTEGMGPRLTKDGKQIYTNRDGTTYAERQGFVGM